MSVLDQVTANWLARRDDSVLVVMLRQMPEGVTVAYTEVHPEFWDFAAQATIGEAIVKSLKGAEERRVKAL